MYVSQSRFLYEGVSESRFVAMFKGLEVPIRLVCIFFKMTSSRHLILNFSNATFNIREKVHPNFS